MGIQELLRLDSPDQVPEEHVVECVCELLRNVGSTLESTPIGKSALIGVCGRIKDLKGMKRKDGKPALRKRIQFAISDVLDARAAGWVMKTFTKTAKTKEEVRLEHEKDLKDAAAGKTVNTAEVKLAGARPAYLGEQAAQAKEAVSGGGDWQDAGKKRKR